MQIPVDVMDPVTGPLQDVHGIISTIGEEQGMRVGQYNFRSLGDIPQQGHP